MWTTWKKNHLARLNAKIDKLEKQIKKLKAVRDQLENIEMIDQ